MKNFEKVIIAIFTKEVYLFRFSFVFESPCLFAPVTASLSLPYSLRKQFYNIHQLQLIYLVKTHRLNIRINHKMSDQNLNAWNKNIHRFTLFRISYPGSVQRKVIHTNRWYYSWVSLIWIFFNVSDSVRRKWLIAIKAIMS